MSALRAIGLIRVSQRDGDDSEHSPEVQFRGLIKHAEDAGLVLDARDIWDENTDDIYDGNGKSKARNVSGSWDLSDRPKLKAAIEAVERGEVQVILAERFDRLFRNLDVQREAIRRIEAAGGRLETVKQGAISHATAEAELHANIDGMIAQYQRRTAKERSLAAVQVAIEQGRWPGTTAPPGLVKGPDGKLLPGTRATVGIVRRAFRLRADGASFDEVRAFLAEHGIERSKSGVRKMLASRLYVGEIHHGGYAPNYKAHDGIVDRELFDQVQKMVVSGGRKAKSDRLLARQEILYCGVCGSRMSASTNGHGYAYYRCTDVDCAHRQVIAGGLIEDLVIKRVKDADATDEGRATRERRARKAAERARRSQAAYARALRILADSDDEEEARQVLAEKRDARDRDREEAERLAAVVRPGATADVSVLDDPETPIETKRSIVRSRVRRVTVSPGRGAERVEIQLV